MILGDILVVPDSVARSTWYPRLEDAEKPRKRECRVRVRAEYAALEATPPRLGTGRTGENQGTRRKSKKQRRPQSNKHKFTVKVPS